MVRFNYVTMAVVTALMVFNVAIRYVELEIVTYVITGIAICANTLYLFSGARFQTGLAWMVPFMTASVIGFVIATVKFRLLVAVVGFVGLTAYLLFWAFPLASDKLHDSRNFLHWYARMHVIFGVICAVSAIYQYIFSSDLHGMLPVRYNTDPNLIAAGFTQRATGLIGSPQNLGAYMGMVLVCIVLAGQSRKVSLALAFLVFIAGLFSGSAAFLAFIFLFGLGYSWNSNRLPGSMLRLALGVPIVFGMMAVQDLDNIDDLLGGSLSVSTQLDNRYQEGIFAINTPMALFFGHGAGAGNRLTEVLLGEGMTPDEWRTSESFFETLFYELGLAGMCGFFLIMMRSVQGALARTDYTGRVLFGALIATLGNLVVAPSFTGLTMAAILWPLLLYPCLQPMEALVMKTMRQRAFVPRIT